MISDYEPWDFYEEYSEWLMRQGLPIFNGDSLISYFEDGWEFDRFMEERHPALAQREYVSCP